MSKLEQILHYFPSSQLPLLLSDDHIQEFEIAADPFPQSFIEEFIMLWENDTDTEITEYIPCASLPSQEHFTPIIYWKAGLLRYDFIMITLDKYGETISRKIIASTIVDDLVIKKSIASIEPDYIINIVAGHSKDGEEYDANLSKSYSMEVLPTGEIIFSMDSLNKSM
jgi:hypothetical protein